MKFSAADRRERPQRAFLQQRLARLGQVLAGLMVLGLAARLVADPAARLASPVDRVLALSTAFPLVLWLTCRRGKLSFQALRLVEAASLFGYALCVAVMGRYQHVAMLGPGANLLQASLDPGPIVAVAERHMATAVALAMSHAVILRAALIPTRPRYTCALTAALGVPVSLSWLPDASHFGAPHLTLMAGPYVDSAAVVQTALWWSMTTAVATVISTVLFRRRRELAQAQRLGQYALEQKLGEGGMGTVYRARQAMMQRPVALKILGRDRTTEAQLERFEREVQLTSRLSHPNAITIFDHGRTQQGEFYYAMELIEGATLDEIVAVSHAQPAERVTHVLRHVAAALVEAHERGLIHRAIKPSNVFLSSLGGQPDVVKLADFGLAKHLFPEAAAERDGERSGTQTPLYQSPEGLLSPQSVDERSDLYSLGAVGYFLLTGEHVYEGATAAEVSGKHLHSTPIPPADRLGRHVPEDLEQLVLDLLQKDASDRPASAKKLLERLASCDGFGRWSDEQAREWWEEHEAAILRLRGRPVSTRGLTVTKALGSKK